MNLANNFLLKSPPIRIRWAGWETDTYRLQQAGWSVAVQELPYDNTIQFAFEHKELQAYGCTEPLDFAYQHHLEHRNYSPNTSCCINLAHEFRFIGSTMPDFTTFIPVDCMPRVQCVDTMDICMSEFKIFKPCPIESREIYLKQASMSEILKFALDKQEPTQEEIRQRMLIDKRIANMKVDSKCVAQLRLVA